MGNLSNIWAKTWQFVPFRKDSLENSSKSGHFGGSTRRCAAVPGMLRYTTTIYIGDNLSTAANICKIQDLS